MSERAILTVQQGVWIDSRQLADAGLQSPLEIAVQSGEIRIRSAASTSDASSSSQDTTAEENTWDVFRSLGRNAKAGRLADPSTGHDGYLYGDAG